MNSEFSSSRLRTPLPSPTVTGDIGVGVGYSILGSGSFWTELDVLFRCSSIHNISKCYKRYDTPYLQIDKKKKVLDLGLGLGLGSCGK